MVMASKVFIGNEWKMKKWYIGIISASLLTLLVLGYCVMENPFSDNYHASRLYLNSTNHFNTTNPIDRVDPLAPTAIKNPENATKVIAEEMIIFDLFPLRNITDEEQQSLHTWKHLKILISNVQGLPNALEAIKEARDAWKTLMDLVEEEKLHEASQGRGKGKQCPHFLSKVNATELDSNGFRLQVPCGLVQGSSITIIGIPNGLLGNFQIDLAGEPLPGEPDPPIILHYNVRMHGDKITENPVIVQNTWTASHDWGEEERCPSPAPEKNKKVDEVDQCNGAVGNVSMVSLGIRHSNGSTKYPTVLEGSRPRTYFPFKQNHLSVTTLRVGSEGFQTTVDGKHITSFAVRETLEPWLVNEIRITGDIKLISVVTSGLPTSEDVEHAIDLESLKSNHLPPLKRLDLFIGVFSTANNFKRRMAVRRTWMQYAAVRAGKVAVRFFVGLHKNRMVNEELWNEARTYGDIQLMPFVDYYNIITWKTIAICTFGTQVVSAKFVMKTDDDAFVRVDEVLASLYRINVSHGLLYGLINSDSRPHRNPDDKWYISTEEWPEDTYPPWAHGPGYVVSSDIAKAVHKRHKNGHLKMFKLEDVAMGIWVAEMKKKGLQVTYEKEERVYNEGCREGYVVAHYQGPREMLCLWQKLQEENQAKCCGS